MKMLKCVVSSDYFTAGKLYPVLDYIEDGGIMTADNDNENHYLSGDYWPNYFEEEETE